jgi:N-acetylglucosamine-6-phosphate deacetylase
MKGKNLLLITDAMRAGCMHNGYYDLGGREVCVSEGKAVLSDGTLAGSILKMNDALKQMYHHTEMTLPEVIRSVTVLPAEKLKLNKGHLQAGYDADIVLFDENFSMIAVIVGGEVKYRCENSI